MSGNESPGGDDSLSLSSSSSIATKASSNVSSIHLLDPKYKNYITAVDKSLKNFEYSSEWHDLISALTKLNKVITSWSGKYGGDLPRLHLVTKRLSQCLHPNLPGGVHLKTLETYELIFKSIPPDRMGSVIGPDLFSFASGLFPLWTYASEQSRPTLLRIYETYLLPLIKHPALEGFLISILSGLSEDDSAAAATTPTVVTDDPLSTMGRVNNLLENVTRNVGVQNFNRVLWQILKANSKIRLAGINYVIRKSAITDDKPLAIDTLTSCLMTSDLSQQNESVLIQRATLDLLLNHFPLCSLTENENTKLIKASLQTLLRRDMSLNRRLFSWLLGNEANYFETHCKASLIISCIEMFNVNDNTLSSSEIVRILISLLDKPEVSILDDILLYIVIYFKRIDSKQCANLFFVNLEPGYVFDQIVAAIESNVHHCSLLEYLVELDLNCFEYEKLLPGVFSNLVKIANVDNIVEMEVVLKLILKKVEVDQDLFQAFISFYLDFVEFNSEEKSFNFDQFLKPKVIDDFWTDFKLYRENCELNIFEKISVQSSKQNFKNLNIVNTIFEEFLDPRVLKEFSTVSNWLKAIIIIGCRGDIDTISLLVKVLKLLEKSLCFEIVEQTYLIELATRFLWEKEQFETLSELICLNKLKVEKILLSFLKDFESFQKLIELLDFVGDFGDCKLLVYKIVENLDCNFEQYPLEFLELREQAEEFCCKMLRESDLRFIDVFISSLLVDFVTVGDYLREKERARSLYLGTDKSTAAAGQQGDINVELDVDRLSIGVESVSDVTSELSYKSMEEENEVENLGSFKANSTPDLTNLNLSNQQDDNKKMQQVLSRSMGDLSKISSEGVVDINNIPEIVVQDQDHSSSILDDDCQKEDISIVEGSSSKTASASAAVVHTMKFTSPFILTPSTELATEARASKSSPRGEGFSKKLNHPHLKVSKEITEDVQNRMLYVLSKMEKILVLKPDLFISYLKSCNTNQSARINYRDDCVYLELLIGKLLDFMCAVIPNDETHNKTIQLGNLNIQFKSCNLLKLLLDTLIETERLDSGNPVSSIAAGSNNINNNRGSNNNNNNTSSTPLSSSSVPNGVGARRLQLSKLKRKTSSSGSSSSHFVADLLTRVKVQRTLLFVLRSTTTYFEETNESCLTSITQTESFTTNDSNNGTDLSLELIKLNYGQKYLTIYQGILLGLVRTIISLETLINSIYYHLYTLNSKSHASLHRHNNHNHKYLAFLPLTNQPLFHEILLTALELRDDNNAPNSNYNHFKWMDLNLHIQPYIVNTNCPMTILTVAQVCKNLQILGPQRRPENENYILRSMDYLIAITNAVLFRHGEKLDKSEETNQQQSSSSIYGIITSFLPGGSTTSPKVETDEVDGQSKDMLSKLDILTKTALAVKSPTTLNKLRNLLNPICNSFLENFLTSLSMLQPASELTELCKEIETIRIEKLTIVSTRILNRNLLLFYRDFILHVEEIQFSPSLLNSLVKECLTKSVGLVTICEVVNDLYNKFKPETWSKQELKELQENLFKIFERLVSEVATQNTYILLDTNSQDSNGSSSGQLSFMSGQGLQGKSYNFKKITTSEDHMEDILSSLSIHLPALMDILWTDDKDRDKVMPMLTHLFANLIVLIKLRHTSTKSYVSILKLLKNISYYSYYRKSWKKEIFEMLLLEPAFFQMIKQHYYNSQPGINDNEIAENHSIIRIWKVIMDNLFTQDKSSFSELLTRVSVPQTTGLNIFTSKDTEFEGRAVLLKRLAFVIWSSEVDQFSKFISNIQERLAEALKTPNSPQIVPVVLRSVFLCFRVLILKFSNLSVWPIIIFEVVQVLLQMEKQLASGSKLEPEQLACFLEVFKLIELLSNLPSETMPLFQMYRWAFLPNTSICTEENVLENNNINNGFTPFLSRIAIVIDNPVSSCSNNTGSNNPSLDKEERINPSKLRTLINLTELSEFLNGNCDTLSLEEICQELDLDFIEC